MSRSSKSAGFNHTVQPLAALSVPYTQDIREAILGISNSSTHTSRISPANLPSATRARRSCVLGKQAWF